MKKIFDTETTAELKDNGISKPNQPSRSKIYDLHHIVEYTLKLRKIIALVIFTIVMSLVYHFVFNDVVQEISGGDSYLDSLHFSIVAMWGLIGEQFNVGNGYAKAVVLAQTSISLIIMAFI